MRIQEIILNKVELIDREITTYRSRINEQFLENMSTLALLKLSLDNLKILIQQWDIDDSSPLEIPDLQTELTVTGIGRL